MPINLFPTRAAIGRGQLPDGSSIDILMTIEFARALADVLQRIGGADGISTTEIITMIGDIAASSVFGSPTPGPALPDTDVHVGESAQISTLRAEVADLRLLISASESVAGLRSQLDDIQVQLGMQDTRSGIVKGTAVGSRGGNAALASLLVALARSGLIIDNTTI